MKKAILKLNYNPCKVWCVETPHGIDLCRGHLNRGYFFNFLNLSQNGKENFNKSV